MSLETQWTATLDQIKKEPIPDAIRTNVALSTSIGLDESRARALHVKLRMRREFPQSFAEAVTAQTMPGYADLTVVYGPRPHFVTALQGYSPGSFDPNIESAILLFLILSRGKGGGTVDVEGIARTKLLPGTPFRVFIDEWGTPIAFRRVMTDTEMAVTNHEINNPPFTRATGGSRDPDDPAGRLISADWPASTRALMINFMNQLLPGVSHLDGRNRGPTVVSAGKDKQFAASSGSQDDLFSFRIQQTNRGN